MTLKAKSEKSIEAARYLSVRTDGLNNSSVHCSYYSCLQCILHNIDSILNLDANQQKNEYDSYVKKTAHPLGSHEYWIEKFCKHIFLTNPNEAKFVRTNTLTLKSRRQEADYRETDFSVAKTKQLYELAKSVLDSINNI